LREEGLNLPIDYLETSSREPLYIPSIAKGKKRNLSNIDFSPLAISRGKNKGKGRAIDDSLSIEDTTEKERLGYSSNLEDTIIESRMLDERANRERLIREDIGEGPSNIERDTSNIEEDSKIEESSSSIKRIKSNKIKVYSHSGRPKKIKGIGRGRARKT